MKKAVISILGTIPPPREGQEKAEYYFSDDLKEKFSLKKERYTNMLPLLLDNFQEYGEIRTIYTNLSKEKQTTVLDYETLDYDIEENGLFVSENIEDKEANYSYFLDKYNELIEEYDRVIIDVSHGFRHFPILAVVNLIIQNIKNPEKIEYIFFAKEIKQFKKYEVIDLKEYLELANLSFMLSTFNQNYTVSSNIQFTNPLYKKVAKELSEFSSHFLSNSFKPLIEGKAIEHIIDNLEELQERDSVVNFKSYIVDIIEHLEDIRQLKYKKESIKLYELSKIMDERGYQLNAITLLFEALGFYCLESIATIEDVGVRVDEFRGYIEAKEKPLHIYSTYTLVNEARVITKIRNRFKVSTFINSYELKNTIIDYLDGIENLNQFKQFIEALEALRNNLAHGNSGFTLKDVKLIYRKNLHKFEKMAIEEDMLKCSIIKSK
jgi:CRISPR-associated DxTHG motif protein